MTEILGERPESVEGVTKRRKLQYYGHQTRKGEMAQVLIEGRVGDKGREDQRGNAKTI